MTQYRYRALDDQGEAVEGTMEESSAHRVTQKLQERGLTVNDVEELYKDKGLLRVSKKLTWEDLQLFTEQLVSVTKSGLPLAPALGAMAADLRNPRLKPVLDVIQHDIEQGVSLEEAIAKHHESFPRVYASLVRAGEASGNLHGVLQLMCGYTARMIGVKQNIQVAMAYPLMVLLIAGLAGAFMIIKVVPVFAEVFDDFGGSLPAPTQFTLAVAEALQYNWPSMLMSIAAIVVSWKVANRLVARTESGRCWLDAWRYRAPILGHLHYLMSLARFSRTLGLLLASRVPALDSLELAAAASGSPVLARAVDDANLQVAGGERIADALASTGFFGHNFCWLLSTGEDRGEAETALDSLALTYERELASRDKMVAFMMSPILILIIGAVVAFFVMSMYLPIFSLGDQIQ